MSRSLIEVDELLASNKTLFSDLEWVEDGPVARLVSPILDMSGNVIGGMLLNLNALTETAVQRGNAALVLDGRPIQRLSFRPDHVHTNKGRGTVLPELRFKRLPADRTRLYSWRDNRSWPVVDNLAVGRLVDPEPASIMAAYQLFLEACGISAYLPEPPHRPRLEF